MESNKQKNMVESKLPVYGSGVLGRDGASVSEAQVSKH